MRALLIVSTLAVGVLCGRCSASGPDRVAEILDAWSKRAEAVKEGEIRWSVPAENWNRFGRFETEWVPASDAAGRDVAGTLRFDEQRACYDSTSFSFAEYAALSAQQTVDVRFRVAAMVARFKEPRYEHSEPLPCTVLYRPGRAVHFWHDTSNERPLALILPAGPAMGLAYLSSFPEWDATLTHAPAGGFSAYLHHLLAAPVLLTFRPVLFDIRFRDRAACEVDESLQPVHEGRTCRVLRVRERAEIDQSGGSWMPVESLYWVDPNRDFVVVRCIIMWGDVAFAQIDVQYEAADRIGWVPSTWSVLRFGERPTTVRQVATAVMDDVDLDREADKHAMDLRLPPGTSVVDRVTPRQYLVRDDLSEQELEGEYRFPAGSYATLVPQTEVSTPMRRRVLRVLLPLIRWPGVLIPVIITSGILIVTKGMLTHRARRGRSGEVTDNPPGRRPPR